MLNRKLLAAIVTAATVSVGYSSTTLAAQNSDTANVTIVAPLAINPNGTNSLDFGSVSPNGVGGGAGTVTVDTAGGRTGVNVGLVGGAGATGDFGGFNVSGCNNCAYNITMPLTPFTLNGLVPGNSLDITAWTTATGSGTATLDGAGNDTLAIGATISVGESQPADDYSASYTVTVDYN